MISHHDVALFERYADKIYEFMPDAAGGVTVRLLANAPLEADPETPSDQTATSTMQL